MIDSLHKCAIHTDNAFGTCKDVYFMETQTGSQDLKTL